VWFAATPSQSILQQSPGEIVAEIPSGPLGEVPVSVWQDLFLVSNVKTFRVDAQPIAHRILAFGDSLVGPWVYHTDLLDTMLNANVGPSLVINEGKAGETLLEGARRLGDILSIHNAVRHVYILEGANDVSDFRNTPAGEMLAALNQMMDTLGTHGLSPILVTLPPRTREALSEDRTWPTTEDWNRTLRLYAIVNRIKWFDLYNAFVTQPDWESFLDDSGLHLSEQGQHFVAQAMYSALAPLLH